MTRWGNGYCNWHVAHCYKAIDLLHLSLLCDRMGTADQLQHPEGNLRARGLLTVLCEKKVKPQELNPARLHLHPSCNGANKRANATPTPARCPTRIP